MENNIVETFIQEDIEIEEDNQEEGGIEPRTPRLKI